MLHVQLDDTAERGTRILQLIDELEAGHVPDGGPVDRRVAADAGRRAAARRRPGRGAVARPSSRRSRRDRAGRAAEARPSKAHRERRSCEPYLARVPDEVVERLRGARRVLAVSHENPDADTLGATLAIAGSWRRSAARPTPVCSDDPPPLYAFMPGVERFRTDPDPAATYDLLVISDCGALSRVGDVGVRHADLFASLPRVIVDHHASNDAAEAGDWIEPRSAATCEMVTLLAARLGVPLTADDGALAANLMAGIVMDTATFAHPNATPRTLAVAGGPRGGRRAAVRYLAAAVSDEARGPAAPVRPDPRPPPEHR